MRTERLIIFYICAFVFGLGFGILGKMWRLPFWFTATLGVGTTVAVGLIIL